jgi:hypothetical protein
MFVTCVRYFYSRDYIVGETQITETMSHGCYTSWLIRSEHNITGMRDPLCISLHWTGYNTAGGLLC